MQVGSRAAPRIARLAYLLTGLDPLAVGPDRPAQVGVEGEEAVPIHSDGIAVFATPPGVYPTFVCGEGRRPDIAREIPPFMATEAIRNVPLWVLAEFLANDRELRRQGPAWPYHSSLLSWTWTASLIIGILPPLCHARREEHCGQSSVRYAVKHPGGSGIIRVPVVPSELCLNFGVGRGNPCRLNGDCDWIMLPDVAA